MSRWLATQLVREIIAHTLSPACIYSSPPTGMWYPGIHYVYIVIHTWFICVVLRICTVQGQSSVSVIIAGIAGMRYHFLALANTHVVGVTFVYASINRTLNRVALLVCV